MLPFLIITGQRELDGSWKSIHLCEKHLEKQGEILSTLLYQDSPTPPSRKCPFFVKSWEKILGNSIFDKGEINARVHFHQMWRNNGLVMWEIRPRVKKGSESQDFTIGLKGIIHPFTGEMALYGFYPYGDHRSAWDLNRLYEKGAQLKDLIYDVTLDLIKKMILPLVKQELKQPEYAKLIAKNLEISTRPSNLCWFKTSENKVHKGNQSLTPNFQLHVKRNQVFRFLYSWSTYCQIEDLEHSRVHSIGLQGHCHPQQGYIRVLRFFGNQSSGLFARLLNQCYFAGQDLESLIPGINIKDLFSKIFDAAKKRSLIIHDKYSR